MQNGLFITLVFSFVYNFSVFYVRRSYNFKIRISNDESWILLTKGAFLAHSVPWPLLRPPPGSPFCVTGVPLSQFQHAY